MILFLIWLILLAICWPLALLWAVLYVASKFLAVVIGAAGTGIRLATRKHW